MRTTAKFPKGVPMDIEDVAAIVGPEFIEMNENPPASVLKVRKEMEGKKASVSPIDKWETAGKAVTELRSKLNALETQARIQFEKGENAAPLLNKVSTMRKELEQLEKEENTAFEEFKKSQKTARERLTWKEAAINPSGLYGFTKAIQRSAETASRKLARTALRVAKKAFSKDEQVVPFLQAHVKRENSKSARVLLAALKEIGPKIASTMKGGQLKEAGSIEYGLYGFKSRTAELGLDSCKEVRSAAGRITADLHVRKSAHREKIVGFFKEHSKQSKCAYAGMLYSCYPDASMKLASAPPRIGTIDVKHSTLDILTGLVRGEMKLIKASNQDLKKGTRRMSSGQIMNMEMLPSELFWFKQALVEKWGSHYPNVKIAVYPCADTKVSAYLNEDGETYDVDGLATVVAWDNDQQTHTENLTFTALYNPKEAKNTTMLASGDWIEWESD